MEIMGSPAGGCNAPQTVTENQERVGVEANPGAGTEGEVRGVEAGLEIKADWGARAEKTEQVARMELAGKVSRVELVGL